MPPTIEASQNSIETNHRRQVEHLSDNDASWLRSLGAELNETDIPAFRELVRLGSHDLREDTDPDTISSVMNARERFYGQILGWDDESSPLDKSYQTFKDAQPSLMPIATFVQTQRVISGLQLDATRVINTQPVAISYAPESVRQKFDNLTELGLDAAKVINALPAAISLAPESVSIKIHALRQAGYISHKQPFPYDRPNVIRSIFILPLESTLAYLASTKQPNNPDALAELPNLARQLMRQQGANKGPERKEHLIDNYETVAKHLGTAALRWASYNRLLPEPEGRKLLSLIDDQVVSGSTA